MGVTVVQPNPWFRWYMPYVAQAAGNITTKWMDQVFDRANNAKQVGYMGKFNESYYPNVTQDMSGADMLTLAAQNQYYSKLDPAHRAIVDNQIKAREIAKARAGLQRSLPSNPQIIGAAISGQQAPNQAQGALPQTQGPVNSGYHGTNLADLVINSQILGVNPDVQKQLISISMPKNNFQNVDRGDIIETYNQPEYGSPSLIRSAKKGVSPDTNARIQGDIYINKMNNDASMERTRVSNGPAWANVALQREKIINAAKAGLIDPKSATYFINSLSGKGAYGELDDRTKAIVDNILKLTNLGGIIPQPQKEEEGKSDKYGLVNPQSNNSAYTAMWEKSLELSGGDPVKAKAMMNEAIAAERKKATTNKK